MQILGQLANCILGLFNEIKFELGILERISIMNLWVCFGNMNLCWIVHNYEFRFIMLTWNCVNLIGIIEYGMGLGKSDLFQI